MHITFLVKSLLFFDRAASPAKKLEKTREDI